jgi:hypothetical protein
MEKVAENETDGTIIILILCLCVFDAQIYLNAPLFPALFYFSVSVQYIKRFPIAFSVRTWLLVSSIPSILVSIFVFYRSLSSPVLRTALNNHVIIVFLCCGLVETFIHII